MLFRSATATNADAEDLVFAISSVTGGTAVFTSNSGSSVTVSGYGAGTASAPITFTPDDNSLSGGYTLTVTNDGASVNHSVTLSASDTTPSITSGDSQAYTFDTLSSFDAVASNADGTDLTFTISSVSSGATAVFNSSGTTSATASGYGFDSSATEQIEIGRAHV